MLESPVPVTPVALNRIYLHKTKRTVWEATEMKKKTPHTPKPHPPHDSGAAENPTLLQSFLLQMSIITEQERHRFTIQQNNSLSGGKLQHHCQNFSVPHFKKSLRFQFFVFALTIGDSWVCQNEPGWSWKCHNGVWSVFSCTKWEKNMEKRLVLPWLGFEVVKKSSMVKLWLALDQENLHSVKYRWRWLTKKCC